MKIHHRSRDAPSRPSYAGTKQTKRRPSLIFVRWRRRWDRRPSRSGADKPRHCEERSDEAIQDRRHRVSDCFVANAPRNDEKESGTPKGAVQQPPCPHGTARALWARSPLGVPPRHLRSATERHRSARATRLPRTCSERAAPMVRKIARIATHFYARPADRPSHASLAGVTRAFTVPVQRDCTRSPVMMPSGRVLPKPPESEVTSRRPREPHSPRRTESPGRRPGTGARFALLYPYRGHLSRSRPCRRDRRGAPCGRPRWRRGPATTAAPTKSLAALPFHPSSFR